tara:strand:- start:744 stop:2066 length:1323 start_codon:yes stop_codon:yes gene_type:complete
MDKRDKDLIENINPIGTKEVSFVSDEFFTIKVENGELPNLDGIENYPNLRLETKNTTEAQVKEIHEKIRQKLGKDINYTQTVDGLRELKNRLTEKSLEKYKLNMAELQDSEGCIKIPTSTTGGHFVHEFLYKAFPLSDESLDIKIFAPFLNKTITVGEVLQYLKKGLDYGLLVCDESIHNNILTIGEQDITVMSKLQHYLPLLNTHNSVMVDIGGHIGYYTLFFQEFLKSKKTYYFEMNEYASNCVNHRYRNDHSVIVENCAVSDKDENVTFYVKESSQMNTLINDGKSKSGKQVQSKRLDSYFGDEKIDLMKIDVEGAEMQVLKGMKRIAKNVRFILLEAHFDEDWPEIVDLLNEYNMECIDIHNGKPINPREGKKTHHCFCKNNKHTSNNFELSMFLEDIEVDYIKFDVDTLKFKHARENIKVTTVDEIIVSKGYRRM